MFNLVRRISRSLIPRPDRPWEEDATSNAPQIGRKRRLSTTELGGKDSSDEERLTKRGRGAIAVVAANEEEPTQEATREDSPTSASPGGNLEQEDVKEVTKGVKEVELEDKSPVAPESVPLPEEVVGELDEASANAANNSFEESKTDAGKDDVASSRSSSVLPEAAEEALKANAPLPTATATLADDAPEEPKSTEASVTSGTSQSKVQEAPPAASTASPTQTANAS